MGALARGVHTDCTDCTDCTDWGLCEHSWCSWCSQCSGSTLPRRLLRLGRVVGKGPVGASWEAAGFTGRLDAVSGSLQRVLGVTGLAPFPFDGCRVIGAAVLCQVVDQPAGGLTGRRPGVGCLAGGFECLADGLVPVTGPLDPAGPYRSFVGVGDVRRLDAEGEGRQVDTAEVVLRFAEQPGGVVVGVGHHE